MDTKINKLPFRPGAAFVVVFLLFCSSWVMRPNAQIIVSRAEGDVLFRNNNKWQPLKEDMAVTGATWIKIPSKGIFALVKPDSSFKKESGSLYIEQVGNMTFEKDPGIWENIWKMWKRLSGGSERKPPAVIKGGNGFSNMAFPVNNESLLNTQVDFKWQPDGRSVYRFLVRASNFEPTTNICDSNIYSGTYVTIPLSRFCPQCDTVSPNVIYKWSIAPPGLDGEKAVFLKFKLMDANTIDSLNKQLNSISKSKLFGPETKIALKAQCYEQFSAYTEAEKVLSNGLSQYPQSEFLKNTYSNFYERIMAQNSTR